MKRSIIALLLIIPIGYIALTFYQALDILGPRDKPSFDSMPWASFKIDYWVKVGEKEKEKRTLNILAPEVVRDLFKKLNIDDISGSSTGVTSQGVLKLSDGVAWDVNVVFEDRIDFGLREDRYYAYVVSTEDFLFYRALKEHCFSHAQKDFSGIQRSSIILRSNSSLSAYMTYIRPKHPLK
ncbi:MAG: hypothetical protein AAGA18_07760 [Verrucomicrobiota bacterium]